MNKMFLSEMQDRNYSFFKGSYKGYDKTFYKFFIHMGKTRFLYEKRSKKKYLFELICKDEPQIRCIFT